MSLKTQCGNAGRQLGWFVAAAMGATALLHGSLIALQADFSLSPGSYQAYLYLAGLAAPSVTAITLT